MNTSIRTALIVLLCALARAASGATATIADRTFPSQVFGETRNYRIFLPPDYETSGKRYPVIYWFHGWSERSNSYSSETKNYDTGADYGGDNIATFVGAHDVIVVKWDGSNPRKPGEDYRRPYNVGPVETDRQFPLLFPELVAYIDAHYRTIADREHRATAGISMGGFMSYWIAGKYPSLVASASSFMGAPEFVVGPRAFPVEYRHEEMRGNYEGIRTRLVMGTQDFIQFYHRRMNLIWNYTRDPYESELFEASHGTPGIAKTLMFHMRAFADPLPKPEVWNHIDVYPEFSVWGWDVRTDRQQPGFTMLANVSGSGFRWSVREWVPSGRILAGVKARITSAPLYHPGEETDVNVIRVRDGAVRRLRLKADSQGRLSLDLDGDEYEVGIGPRPVLALAGYTVEDASWAADTVPVRVRVRFLNKGASGSAAARLRWETPNPGVRLSEGDVALPPLEPGRTAEVPLRFTVLDDTREIFKVFAVTGGARLPLEIPTFPPAAKDADFRLADGRSLPVYQHGVTVGQVALGTGNADGQANPGEHVALLLKDGNAYRAAEVFTNDACVDLSTRASDAWSSYDSVGATVKYSLPLISSNCAPGHWIHALARVQLPDKPNHKIRYAAVDFQLK